MSMHKNVSVESKTRVKNIYNLVKSCNFQKKKKIHGFVFKLQTY